MTEQEKKLIKRVKQEFGIYGDSEKLNNAVLRAIKFAKFNISVLIIGESGSGKDVFSKIIHRNSSRSRKNCLAVNCGSIPQGTIDSELFGYVKGAFTGALNDTKGYFEITDGGTLFLDEIGEMPMSTQARLLRVLENGEFIKVGASSVQKTDVRIVAATNRDLLKSINEGKFRSDLYYRLSDVIIEIPPLRERTEDIPKIARFFADSFADEFKMGDKHFSEEALELLKKYSWPGNVRQLKSFVKMCMIEDDSMVITPETVKKNLPQNTVLTSEVATVSNNNSNTGDNNYIALLQMMAQMLDRMNNRLDTMNNERIVPNINANVVSSAPSINAEQYNEAPIFHKAEALQSNIPEPKYSQRIPTSIDNPVIVNNIDDYDRDYVIELENLEYNYKSLKDIEKEAIESALKRNNYNRKITAQQLEIAERTLYRKIKEYNL